MDNYERTNQENYKKILTAIKEVYGDGQEYVEVRNTLNDFKSAYDNLTKGE